ncbi:hypothetical protein H6F74_00075 [Trichocoleus sp. FACHB-90]|uniref:Uncharacterized protein n=1 Tax=Funiculus sociatus GB2-A5 TaxID=2933946 RepID=A0ABV0JX11_9CYAN|nr:MULTISPECIES: hypothetical protein [unclassified Trichocoleus]MBD1905681.1 hypothetical protein [Trichocoleus sp. FACHB-832]MBD1924689.1 hypothetical protein [Trichocoleus sp. FACHB-90]MBD2064898.1 hypothetical protein [Trichocoleus sp. FACHB-6]
MNQQTLNYLETFEGWLLIVFSNSRGYGFQVFNPVGEKIGEGSTFNSVAAAVQRGRKFITGAKL